MASAWVTSGSLFAGMSGLQIPALADGYFTIAHTSSAPQPVEHGDVEMVTPENCIVTVPTWLSFLYSKLQKEIEYFGNVILEIQRQEENPPQLAPDIYATYKVALHYLRQLYGSV